MAMLHHDFDRDVDKIGKDQQMCTFDIDSSSMLYIANATHFPIALHSL